MDGRLVSPSNEAACQTSRARLTYVEHVAGSLVGRPPILYGSVIVRLHLGPSLTRWRQPLSLLCPPRQAELVPAHVTIPERVKGVFLPHCELHSCT